jgi:hypothetical protein
MPKLATPLTDMQQHTAKPKAKPCKLADGDGLHLLMKPDGAKYWRMNYRFEGDQNTLAFGKYPDTGGNEHLFPNQRDHQKPATNFSILAALKRMGYSGKMTGHGFRSLAMGVINERLGYRHEVVDRQLSHASGDSYGEAYDRALNAMCSSKGISEHLRQLNTVLGNLLPSVCERKKAEKNLSLCPKLINHHRRQWVEAFGHLWFLHCLRI